MAQLRRHAGRRLSVPEALYLTELLGVALIFAGFSLTARPSAPPPLSKEALRRRRHRLNTATVGLGVSLLLGSLVILPVLPWTMGIVTDVKHVYTPSVPEENRGAYLVTPQGAMQLYAWYVEPAIFPGDAPTLDADAIRSIVVVQKQFAAPEDYRLFNLTAGRPIAWQSARTQAMHLTLTPAPLPAGDYVLVVPTDSMFGGQTQHYFRLR
jgi:hypothetical protein